jgi:para-nitrobenzyl esterase
MNKIYSFSKSIVIATLLIFSVKSSSAQCGQRYHDKIFVDSLSSNIQYGSNIKMNNQNQNLMLDMYFPKGDTETARPLIIIAHGGNFLGGSKTGPDVVSLSKDWAKMGYVVASIEYRVGMTGLPLPGPDSTDAGEAVMRAVHDAKASVRFFKNSYANGNPYKIDTNLIFFSGVSAGGFMALHLAYMDEMSEFPIYIDTVNQYGLHGGIEGNSNSLPYNSKVAGVINICGAIGDTAWIKPGDVPMCLFHGSNDNTVPYGSEEITLLGLYPLLQVDGSESIAERAAEMGIEFCFEIHEGKDHTPHVSGSQTAQYYDTTLNISRNFLAKYVCGDAMNCSYGPTITSVDDLEEVNNLISVYPNPATNFTEILFNENNFGAEFNLYDIHGKLISTQVINDIKITLNRNNLPAGIYFIRITNGEKVQTSKLVFE